MANRSDITPELCRQLLRYEPETGKLFWLPRCASTFHDEGNRAAWNGKWAGKEAFTNTSSGYRQGWIFGIAFLAHRVAWAIYYGDWPVDYVDHINRVRHDNRIANLRGATHSQNLRNCKPDARNKSGIHGVFWDQSRSRWVARIRHDGRSIQLGRFTDKTDAANARRAAELKYGYMPGHGVPI